MFPKKNLRFWSSYGISYHFRYEERFPANELPVEKWITYEEKDSKVKKSKIELKTKKNTVDDIVDNEWKPILLMKSDLPISLENEVAKNLKLKIPAIRRASSVKGIYCQFKIGTLALILGIYMQRMILKIKKKM